MVHRVPGQALQLEWRGAAGEGIRTRKDSRPEPSEDSAFTSFATPAALRFGTLAGPKAQGARPRSSTEPQSQAIHRLVEIVTGITRVKTKRRRWLCVTL